MGKGTMTVRDDVASAEAASSTVDVGREAELVLEAALHFVASKMRLRGPQDALDHLCAGQRAAHGYFRYALAQEVMASLAALDGEVVAGYLYDDEATPEDEAFGEVSPVSLIHLIVRASRPTEALSSLIASLDRALVAGYGEMIGRPHLAHLLDVQVLSEDDINAGRGAAALLNSVHHRPVKVWER